VPKTSAQLRLSESETHHHVVCGLTCQVLLHVKPLAALVTLVATMSVGVQNLCLQNSIVFQRLRSESQVRRHEITHVTVRVCG
jgi:hypothetical protein